MTVSRSANAAASAAAGRILGVAWSYQTAWGGRREGSSGGQGMKGGGR
jgi:hypothetical protein